MEETIAFHLFICNIQRHAIFTTMWIYIFVSASIHLFHTNSEWLAYGRSKNFKLFPAIDMVKTKASAHCREISFQSSHPDINCYRKANILHKHKNW